MVCVTALLCVRIDQNEVPILDFACISYAPKDGNKQSGDQNHPFACCA